MFQNRIKKRWTIFLVCLILMLGFYWLFLRAQPIQVTSRELLPELTDARDRSIEEIAQEVADANYFTLNISPVAYFEDGESVGDIEIINPGTNVYPISVVITLDETGEEIYQSGAIYPNQEIRKARLMNVLQEGEHSATATIDIYDPETSEKQGSTQAGLMLIIKN
ncbi:hypothetical protein HIU98_19005 [Enterococcus casseliflavus]|nr:hypothetical protein [Enterococcus casseliflavus]